LQSLLNESNSENINTLNKVIDRYLNTMNDKIEHHGKTWAGSQYKLYHSNAVQLALGIPLSNIPFVACQSSSGVPKVLSPLKQYLLSPDPQMKRIGLTITRSYEDLYGEPIFSPEVITKEGVRPTEYPHTESYLAWLPGWVSRLPLSPKSPEDLQITSLKGNLVMGPNGPSILTAHHDALAITKDPELFSNIKRYCEVIGDTFISPWIQSLAEDFSVNKEVMHSRISLISEGGLKTRTIAIGDYFSQNLLRPLHNVLMGCLRKMRTDGTYTQNESFQDILGLPLGTHIHCTDLTSATDRAPAWMQEMLISCIFGKNFGSSWLALLRNRDYQIHKKGYRWASGQPLGLLSSWCAFTLWHHSIIEYSAFQEGFHTFRNYKVLGDDVCIWSDEVASRYEKNLSLLGMPINKTKSLVSLGQIPFGEFAKRVFLNGSEISGLKPKLVRSGYTSIAGYIDLYSFARTRSWDLRRGFTSPRHFSKEDVFSSKVVAYYKGWLEPLQMELSFSPIPTIEEMTLVINKLRIANMYKLLARSYDQLEAQSGLKNLFDRGGAAVNPELLQLTTMGREMPHPMAFHIHNSTEQLLELAQKLMEVGDLDNPPEMLEIEYLPNLSRTVYFGDKKILKSKLEVQLITKAWKEITSSERDSPMPNQVTIGDLRSDINESHSFPGGLIQG
jgi:hypothetical protein